MSNSSSPIVVTHDGDLRFSVAIGPHLLVVDQPARAGGGDGGPGPLDLLGGALGACVAFYVHQFCEARAIPHAGLRVEVTQHKASAPSRIGGFEVRVSLPPDVPDGVMPLVERVARSCPAHNTLAHGASVAVAVETIAQATTLA